jgi:hypothetical protein
MERLVGEALLELGKYQFGMYALAGFRCKKEVVHHEIKQCAFGNKDGSVCNYVIQVDSCDSNQTQ